MKPAGKIKLWTGGYVNRPGVTPPVYLRVLLSVLLLLSLGTLLYGAFGIMGHFGYGGESPGYLVALAFLFFVIPFLIVYAISTNHPSSRVLLVTYYAVLTYIIIQSYRSVSSVLEQPHLAAIIAFFLYTVIWLYSSPRARVYYALIQDEPIPDDLAHMVDQLVAPTTTEKLARRVWTLVEPLSPFLTFIFALFLVYAGFRNLNP